MKILLKKAGESKTVGFKKYLKKVIPKIILELRSDYINIMELKKWNKKGREVPPPHFLKQLVILEYQKKSKVNYLVETGTYLGDMIYAQRKKFNKIYSIELSHELYQNAVKRFEKFPHIEIHFGDSGKILNEILPFLKNRAIFWLDGHFSGGITAKGESECPIFFELEAIFKNNLEHIILIDDARLFNGEGDYPTIDEVKNFINKKNNGYKVSVKDDIIRAVLE